MDDRLFPESLCGRCRWLQLITGARSTFFKCSHPELPRYPRQPVRACRAFEAAPGEKVEE